MGLMSQTHYRRILPSPRGSFFLFGMRGTGKSTWLADLDIPATQVNLLDEDLYQRILASPAVFSGMLEQAKPGSWVFVDEVQRLPGLLNDVHRFIESRKLKFALTGSSARKLRRGGTNLLAGRAVLREMFPLVPEEMGPDFRIEDALSTGTLPLILAAERDERTDRLKAYVRTYLKEEIQAEALVRNLAGFARFLPVAGVLNGQVVSVSSIARECGVERTTVAGFIEILKDSFLAFEVPGFEAKLRLRERKHPKVYWLDNGVARAARGDFGEPAAEERGALFEAWVAQMLRAYQSYRGLFDEMHYWAPAEAKGIEVDFLLKRGRAFVAIEAKSGSRYREDWTRSLRAISSLPGIRKRIIVHPGREALKTPDGIQILTIRGFCDLLEHGELF